MWRPRHFLPCVLTVLSGLTSGAPASAQVTILHSFTGGANDGQSPSGALVQSGSTLYGVTPAGGNSGDGTAFRIGADGIGFGLLHSFAGLPNDGSLPHGALIQSGPTFYGMSEGGGVPTRARYFG